MENKIGAGIIGAGAISNFHANGYLKDKRVRIVAVCDVIEEKAKEKAKKWGASKWFTDSNNLMEDKEIDAVSICLPPYLHAQVAVAAAEAGKHILVEKPMAPTLKECDEIIEASDRSKVKLMVGHNQLFFPPIREARRLVESEIGKPLMLVTRLHSGFRIGGWRSDAKIAGGGFLMEAGIHNLYVSRFLMGEAERISSMIGKLSPNLLVEDLAMVCMEFKNGSYGSLIANCGGTFPLWDDRTEIIGTKGMVIINGVEAQIMTGPPLLFYRDGQWKLYCRKWVPAEMKEEMPEKAEEVKFTANEIEADWSRTFVYETQHFVDSIVNDTTPAVSGEDGKKTIQLIRASYESAEKGVAVCL